MAGYSSTLANISETLFGRRWLARAFVRSRLKPPVP